MKIGLALAIVASSGVFAAPLEDLPEPPGDVMLLVQPEIDFLPGAGTPITLELEKDKPLRALREIGRMSGLSIEVRGSLPATPRLTASFRDTPARDVLAWFAQQLPVRFRAEPPHKLWVLIDRAE
jgi:hypothetical protein